LHARRSRCVGKRATSNGLSRFNLHGRLAKYREDKRANFDTKTQSISGESSRQKLEVGKLLSSVRAA
jgi:hypothetical protein